MGDPDDVSRLRDEVKALLRRRGMTPVPVDGLLKLRVLEEAARNFIQGGGRGSVHRYIARQVQSPRAQIGSSLTMWIGDIIRELGQLGFCKVTIKGSQITEVEVTAAGLRKLKRIIEVERSDPDAYLSELHSLSRPAERDEDE